jgi:hypothetical protein
VSSFSLKDDIPSVWQVRLPWVVAYILTDGKQWTLVDSGTRRDRIRLLQILVASIGDWRN